MASDHSDSERANLVKMESQLDTSSASSKKGKSQQQQQQPDWSRYGLSAEEQKEAGSHVDEGEELRTEHNELYGQDKSLFSKPWWQANFLISSPIFFGSWDGVFTSCMINIFGVIIFLRTGWVVGNAGIGLTVLIIFITISVALIAALSGICVCERCNMETGGVYFLVSHVLGARVGASIGIIYCFGQAVACSLYVVGFGESIAGLLNHDSPWLSRGIGVVVILLLVGINVAGVKWVIRLQLILLLILLVAMLDFLVGSFVHTDIANGFVGYSLEVFRNNSGPQYMEHQTFFTVFGVFFPTATGVFAGINMSGDLRNPTKNIPVGTLSAVGVSTLLYLIFALVLGATCLRYNLQNDYMIAEKVSIVGVLFLAGLYVSSISSCMGTLYGSPRILQCIASDKTIPFICVLARGKGPNRVPVFALLAVTSVSLIFVFVGDVNRLGPIVTMPFMLTYATVDYAYFALAMSYDKKKKYEERFAQSLEAAKIDYAETRPYQEVSDYEANGKLPDDSVPGNYGAIRNTKTDDLDNLFPERLMHHPIGAVVQPTPVSPTFVTSQTVSDSAKLLKDEDGSIGEIDQTWKQHQNPEITRLPRSFYSIFCNRWLSMFGCLMCVVVMFAIQWLYAMLTIVVVFAIYMYIGQTNPGVFPGVAADFNLWQWFVGNMRRLCRRQEPPSEHIVVTPGAPLVSTTAAVLTADNEDFADRGRYHQSEVVKNETFGEHSFLDED